MKKESPTATVFDKNSKYWIEIANARPTEKQLKFVNEKIEPLGLVLDLGCGNARLTIPLAKAGYDMMGIDVSPLLLLAAKRNGVKAGIKVSLIRADMRFLPFRSKTFTAIISLDTSFGYFSTLKDALGTLEESARTLTENGVFLLDVFNREHMVHLYERRLGDIRQLVFRLLSRFLFFQGLFSWREYPSFYMLQHRSVLKNGDKLRDIWVFRDKKTSEISFAQHVVWLYSLPDLKQLFLKADLKIKTIYGNYEGVEYGGDSSRLIVISLK